MPKLANETMPLDERDHRILELVQRDGKLSQAEIAKRVGLSTAAVNERLRKLENGGVIRAWAAIVDPRAVGAGITAYVDVFIEHPRYEPAFLAKVRSLDAVQECHHITGEFSLLLKIRVRDIEGLQRLLLEQINPMDGVRQTRTSLVLSTVKEESFIPIGSQGDLS